MRKKKYAAILLSCTVRTGCFLPVYVTYDTKVGKCLICEQNPCIDLGV